MSFISCGECKKKNIFIVVSIIFCYLIFQTEYYSSLYYDCHGLDTPQLFSLYFTFTFLGSILFGGLFYIIIENNLRDSRINNIFKGKKKGKKKKKKKKKSITLILLYEEKFKDNPIPIEYFVLSTFLELISNFATFSIAFDFIDIESKMLFNGFEIIIIKIIGKFLFKYPIYKHHIISIIILSCLLIFGIIIREQHLQSIINNEIIINDSVQKYIQETSKKKFKFNILIFYLAIIIIGNIAGSFSVWYDNWLMDVKLCSPYKLILIKGLLGVIPAFSIQLLLYHYIGEKSKFEGETINLISILKRVSFPFSSFSSFRNIIIIIIFCILVGIYHFSIIYTNNKFHPDFVGLVIISSSGLSLISNEIFNILISESHDKIYYLLPICYFIISLITSLIICEIIILHFCGCDKNTASYIDRRGIIESTNSFRTYLEDEFKENKNNLTNFEDLSYDSKDND